MCHGDDANSRDVLSGDRKRDPGNEQRASGDGKWCMA